MCLVEAESCKISALRRLCYDRGELVRKCSFSTPMGAEAVDIAVAARNLLEKVRERTGVVGLPLKNVEALSLKDNLGEGRKDRRSLIRRPS